LDVVIAMEAITTPTCTKIPSAISRVSYYIATPVETCDRCGQGIKHVAAVFFKDDSRRVFGMDCINKVLSGDTSLRCLFRKNVETLKYRKACLRALELGEKAPVGSEYYGSGMFFIATETGEDVRGSRGESFWHPTMDVEKNLSGDNYRQDGKRWLGTADGYNTTEAYKTRALRDLEKAKVWVRSEVDRLESFLAKILRAAAAKGFSL
jgi:hypothetical protein